MEAGTGEYCLWHHKEGTNIAIFGTRLNGANIPPLFPSSRENDPSMRIGHIARCPLKRRSRREVTFLELQKRSGNEHVFSKTLGDGGDTLLLQPISEAARQIRKVG